VKPIATIYRTTDDQYFVVEIEGPSGFQRPPYSFVSSYAYEIETFVRRIEELVAEEEQKRKEDENNAYKRTFGGLNAPGYGAEESQELPGVPANASMTATEVRLRQAVHGEALKEAAESDAARQRELDDEIPY
jgi:hypothetical protein